MNGLKQQLTKRQEYELAHMDEILKRRKRNREVLVNRIAKFLQRGLSDSEIKSRLRAARIKRVSGWSFKACKRMAKDRLEELAGKDSRSN